MGIVDLMLGVPAVDRRQWYRQFDALIRDPESRGGLRHGAGYMFKDLPEVVVDQSYPEFLVGEMNRFGVDMGLLPVSFDEPIGRLCVERYPDRFLPSYYVDPNAGMEGVRALERAVRELGVVAATAFPCGYFPQVPINDKRFYPLYAKCIELDIPIFINAGVPGPRMPFAAQHVELIDEVCWFFPELRMVTRHGCEPWTELAVKLMLKWPNLYYSTSAFAPRYYPRDIIEFANTRGVEKVMFAGYFPSGLSYDRIFRELPAVPFRDHVWPRFLRENALAVLKHDTRQPKAEDNRG
ncbi:MAG TPA: amidohydrolase family protein [Acidimicrobiales bacterium]|nr:amidohydrolase family protein [Acidimicrobiales bacterium]